MFHLGAYRRVYLFYINKLEQLLLIWVLFEFLTQTNYFIIGIHVFQQNTWPNTEKKHKYKNTWPTR